MSIVEAFFALEGQVAGYNDYIDCTPESFKKTLEGLENLVGRVQQEAVFSKNESLKDIDTNHMKLLLIPCLEADVLYRMMDDRPERVRQCHVYYLEFLKLMKHYNLLEEGQQKKLKDFQKKYADSLKGKDLQEEQVQDPMAQLLGGYEDRDTKIANYKMKKMLESNLERLKDYTDEDMKREMYKCQIQMSIMGALDQLGCTEMEIQVLKHQASLSKEEHIKNQKLSEKPDERVPLKAQYIGPDDVNQIPVLFPQMAVQLPTQAQESGDGQFLCPKHADAEPMYTANTYSQYGDPRGGLSKKVERVVVQHDDANDRMNLQQQYKDQVFQPFFDLPTMTLEEFADMEIEDALEREEAQKKMEAMKAEQDESDEEVLEEQRAKDTRMDDWKDWNPKGKGITKRI